jgi:hypothetical protein
MEEKMYGGTAAHMTDIETHNGLYYLATEKTPHICNWDKSMSGETRSVEKFGVTTGTEAAILSQESRFLVYWHADYQLNDRPLTICGAVVGPL